MKKFRLLLVLFFVFMFTAAAFNFAAPTIEAAHADSYFATGPNPDREEDEYIYYSRKESSFYYFNMPCYTNNNNNKSICGPVSGAIVTGYYAYYYPALVPGWQTYSITSTGNIIFYTWNIQIDYLIDTYTNIMSAQAGVTVANYKQGLSAYFKLIAGVTVYYNRLLMSGSSIHWASCVSEINALRPIVLFLSYYNLSYIANPSAGQDKLHSDVYINNHVMTADGYETVKYYEMQSGVETLFRTDCYLWVETGWQTWGKVYLGRNFAINDAYGVGAY